MRVCGSDVLGFLQGLVTNDVQRLEDDSSAMYAMMLNVQARVIEIIIVLIVIIVAVIVIIIIIAIIMIIIRTLSLQWFTSFV